MDINLIAILAIGIALAGLSVLRDIYRRRAEVFDDHFTAGDRADVTRLAFFLLLPISVALHEVGHAAAVWSFGAEVVDFGFFFFAGYVSYQGFLTEPQRIVIAASGTAVNILLAGLAISAVLLKRPPLRAPWNELLIQFAILTSANALIFYPMLDLLTGMNADFRQMYFGGVPWLSAIIFAIHAGTLGGGYLLFKSERSGARLSALTGLPPHVRRGVLGGLNRIRNEPGDESSAPPLAPREAILHSAIGRVASGWSCPVQPAIVRGPDGLSAGIVRWQRDGVTRSVSIIHRPGGPSAVLIPEKTTLNPSDALAGQTWRQWTELPAEDELVLALRTAMEAADAIVRA